MFEFRVWGVLMGEVTRSWQRIEAESIVAARTWPLVTIANTVEAPQRWHVVLRTATAEPDEASVPFDQERGDVEYDGKRMTEKWWNTAQKEGAHVAV